MPPRLDLLVLGDVNPDLVLRGDVEPAFGQAERLVEAAHLTIGGSGAIVACGAARLGLRVALCGVVGDDLFGRFMRYELKARGVVVDGLVVDASRPTGVTVVLSKPHDRAILTHPGTILELRAAEVDLALLGEARHVHVSSYYLLRGLAPDLPGALRRRARGRSHHVSRPQLGFLRDVGRSGDAFLAGLIVALETGRDWPAALKLALGTATAQAETPGAGRLDRASQGARQPGRDPSGLMARSAQPPKAPQARRHHVLSREANENVETEGIASPRGPRITSAPPRTGRFGLMRPPHRRRVPVALALAAALVLLVPAAAVADPGDLDPAFGTGGMTTIDVGGGDTGRQVLPIAGGKLLVLAQTDTDLAVIRLESDGDPDLTFGGGDGIATQSFLEGVEVWSGIALLPNGKIVVVSDAFDGAKENLGVHRFTANGDVDSGFGGGDGKRAIKFDDDFVAYDLAVLPSGKLIVSGELTVGSDDTVFAVVRLNPAGTLDTSFGGGDGIVTTQFGPGRDGPWRVAIDPFGRIVAGGFAEEVGLGPSDVALARYTADGHLDHSFSGDGKLRLQVFEGDNDYIQGMALSGSKIVAGLFLEGGPSDKIGLARFTPNGALDPTFGGGDGEVIVFGGNREVTGLAIDGDGRILAGGADRDPLQMFVARFKPGGKLDTTFGTDGVATTEFGGFAYSQDLQLQPNGKIVLTGSFGGDVALARFLP